MTNGEKNKNKRITYSVDNNTITDNIGEAKKGYTEEQIKIWKNFAQNLNQQLEEKEIDQEKFAGDLKISTGSLSNYRNGKAEPKLCTLVKIADELNVSINFLIGKSECPKYQVEDINKKLGLSQKAIEELYRWQHDYDLFENYFDIDITEDRKISTRYKKHLHILNSLIESSGSLFFILEYAIKYKEKYEKYKEDKDILDIDKERDLEATKYSIVYEFILFIDKILKIKEEEE